MNEFYTQLADFLEGDPINLLLEYIGTFASAISGVRLASIKRFDWFGAFVVGFVTALGGGTLRDLCLNIPPFWMTGPSYIITTFLACVAVALFGRRFISEQVTWFVFDTIALALFTIFGLEKSILLGFPWWCAIMMGVITAVFGGILRDVLINEVPLIFRKELYAMACVAGAVLYCILREFGVDNRICAICCGSLVFLLRALAIKYKWGVPVLKGHSRRLPFQHRREKPRHHPLDKPTSDMV